MKREIDKKAPNSLSKFPQNGNFLQCKATNIRKLGQYDKIFETLEHQRFD